MYIAGLGLCAIGALIMSWAKSRSSMGGLILGGFLSFVGVILLLVNIVLIWI